LTEYTRAELLALGFDSVGDDVMVSRDARFFAISGHLGDAVRIDAFAVLTGHIELGNGVHISPFCFLGGSGGKIVMEDRSGLSTHVSVFTKSDDYRVTNLEAGKKLEGDVVIKAHSIVGSGSRVMPGIVIHEDASIGCNSVVNKDIERGAIVINRGMGLVPVSNRG
jgi:acetyltransferase-like isoleucine patch superfamily enzyme